MHTDYTGILPIDRGIFGPWTARVSSLPVPTPEHTVLIYEVEFKGPSTRRLILSVPKEALLVENRQQEVFDDVQRWLEEQDGDGELRSCFLRRAQRA